MTPEPPTSLRRLARANPVPADQVRTDPARAQAVLERIVATPRASATRRRPRRSRRFAGIAAVALLVSAGGAFAATDPFGFWHSTTPGTALYGLDSSRHARPVKLQEIQCRPTAGRALRCGAHARGTRYELMDRIQPPPSLSRSTILAALRRSGMSEASRRRFESDLAAVPDSFLARLNTMLRFGGNYSSSSSTVPPPGVPMWLECGRAGAAIACRDLNGDAHTPVGSSIYMAVSGPGWRPAPAGAQPDDAVRSRLMTAILGRTLTPAEIRVLVDLGRAVTVSGSARGGPTRAPAPPSGG